MLDQLIYNIIFQLSYYENNYNIPLKCIFKSMYYILSLFYIVSPGFAVTSSIQEQNVQSFLNLYSFVFSEVVENFITKNYFILMINLFFIILILWLLIYNIHIKRKVKERLNKDKYSILFIKLFIMSSSLIQYILIHPFLCITLLNLRNNLSSNSIGWIINDILFIIILHLLTGIHQALFDYQLEVNGNEFRKINSNILENIYFIIYIAQIYIYSFSDRNNLYLQSVLFLISTIMQYVNIFIFKIYIDNIEVYVILFVQSLGIIISFCNIFSFTQTYFYSLLLVPFIFYISIRTFDIKQAQIQTKQPNQLQLSELNLIICTQFKNTKLTDMLFLMKIIMMNKHIVNCEKSLCSICDKQKICYKLAINIEEENLLLFYTLLYIQEIKSRKQNVFLNEFYYFCHYLSANQQLGQNQEVQINLEQRIKLYTQFSYFKLQAFKHILKQQQFNQFSQKLLNETKESQEVSLKVAAFIKSESFNQQIKDDVLKIAQLKVVLFEQFQNLSEKELLLHVQTIICEIRKTEQVLMQLFEKFQSMKNRSLLLFFYVELVNDWLRAYDYQSFNYYEVQQAFNTSEINFNSTKMNYVTCSYENRLLRLETFSKNSPKLFGYELNEFKKIDNVNILIPECVAEVHNHYVENLIEVGEGKYFRKKGINVIQNKNGFLQPCNFFYEFYYDNEHHFRFIVFLEQMINNPVVVLLIDKERRISGISKNIFKAVNFQSSKSELQEIQRILYGMPIKLLFSSIHFDQQGLFAPDSSKLILHFPNEYAFKIFKGIGINQRINMMKHKNNVKMYEVSYEYCQSSNYGILRLFHFQEYDQYNSAFLIHQDTKSSAINQYDINEEDLILFPYEDNQIQEYKIAFDSIQVIQTYRNQEELLVSKKEIDLPLEQQLCNYSYETNDNDNENDLTVQQLGDVYATVEQQVDMQANDMQSYASSLGGLRRSQYYKKYQLIHYLTNKKILGKWISSIIVLLLLFIIIQGIMLSIITSFTNQDFGILEYFYKAIQVNHYFIEPLQKFFLTRYILQDYIIAKIYRQITAEQYNQYTIFVNDTLTQQYFFLQNNFQEHFSDPLTQSFLADRYVNISQAITYSTPIKFSTTNMTLLSAFNLLVEAFYEQYRQYVYPKSIPGTSAYSTYQYINYMLFIDSFNDVADQIFHESKNEIELIIRKWLIVQIPILIIEIGVLIGLFYYSLKYKKILENLLNLFQLTNQNSIDRDAKRLKFIISTIGNQSDLMHKYQFNVDIKEKYIQDQYSQNEKYYSYKDLKEKKSSKIIKKRQLPIYYLIILITFLFIQYLAIIISLQEISLQYLNKYPNTVQLFKSLSDLGVYLPASYYQKELIYMWSFFSYYTTKDRNNFINQIEIAIDSIQSYQNKVYSNEQYQFSDAFFKNYQDKITQNICNILNEDNYQNFNYTCYNAMDGILLRGLRVALTQFQNELITNIELNFTGRINYPIMEMEAAYFSSDVITILVDGMSKDINTETQKIQTILYIIEIIAILITILQIYLIISPIYEWYKRKLICVKQISFILPQETVFLNDHYERDLRQISIKEQLI